jgi:hypothetical protein
MQLLRQSLRGAGDFTDNQPSEIVAAAAKHKLEERSLNNASKHVSLLVQYCIDNNL